MRFATLTAGAVFLASCGGNPAAPGSSHSPTYTVGASAQYRTIQSALDAAPPESTIDVRPGTYAEHVVITKAVTLRGTQAVLDGLAGNLNGRNLGFEVKADHVEISGFAIQGFERGIVLDRVSRCRIARNEVRNNLSKDPQPISPGVTKSDGIVLLGVQESDISDNFIHDNGSIGLMVWLSSSGNTIRRNRVVNNGVQQSQLGRFNGAGIQSGAGNNTRNEITDNEVTGNDWGISIGAEPDSANVVSSNRVHENRRAGIVVYGQHNRVENNDATGNSLVNLMPNCGLDLAEFRDTDNTWVNNTGRFGALLLSATPGTACP